MQGREPAPSLDTTVAAAAAGDADAWRHLVQACSGRVFGLILRQCGDRDLAEELTQATFVKIVHELGRYQHRGRFEPWLFRVAMNLLRDEMRRRKRQAVGAGGTDQDGGPEPSHDARFDPRPGPEEAVAREEQLKRLREEVAKMNRADQEILHLRHTAGMTFAQIAESLGQPLGTVLARGHRALAKLRESLADLEAV